MNLKRKIWALLLSAALIISCFPAMAFAVNEPENTAEDNAAAEITDLDMVTDDAALADGSEDDSEAWSNTWEPVKVLEYYGDPDAAPGETSIPDDKLYANRASIDIEFKDKDGKSHTKSYVYDEYSYTASGKTVKKKGFLVDGGNPALDDAYLEAFYYEDENSSSRPFKNGWNTIKLLVKVPYQKGIKSFIFNTRIFCSIAKPTKIEFAPAKGFKLQGHVGYNYIDESFFFGKGNKFNLYVEEYSEDSDGNPDPVGMIWPYDYVKVKEKGGAVEGFFSGGNIKDEQLVLLEEPMDVFLKKGANKVTIPYLAYIRGEKEPKKLEFTVTIYANKYYTYCNYPILNYTGKYVTKKALTKKLVIRDSSDRKIPASAYTIKWKKHKKMGWYNLKVVFKDKKKYDSPLIISYGIGPKTPKIIDVNGGKKKLTVTWKKFTKAQLKKIDGMYIEIAQDKNFTKGYKGIKVTKKALKKSSRKTIKKLKGKKKYYVRIQTYKKIKQGGEKFEMFSEYSKAKTAKTKK